MFTHFALLSVLFVPFQVTGVSVQASSHLPVRKIGLCNSQNPGMPAFTQSVNVSAYRSCNATTVFAGPWSGAISPDGNFFYTSLAGYAGGFGVENCLLAKVDAQTFQVVNTISVGLFPEEIVFTKLAGGGMQYGFVSNSSSGTVSVFDAADQVVAMIALPDTQGFGTCYPFGLAVSANGQRVYVGTLDGSGDIYVIDTQALTTVPAETLNIPGGHGRLAFYGSTLIVPVTVYDPSFLFSTGKVAFVNPSTPSSATTVTLASTASFPSPQDVAVRCDGRAYVAGIDLGSDVFVFHVPSKTLLHTIPALTSAGYHQGIGLSSRGLLAVADYGSSEMSFFNVWNEQPITLVDMSNLPVYQSLPTEAIFSSDGKKLLVPGNGSDTLAVFQIP